MEDNEQLIVDIQKAIVNIYRRNGLNNLRGLDDSYLINGRPLLVWYYDSIRKNSLKENVRIDYNKIIDDILFCCDELLYFTAHLYLYLPFINDPIEDGFSAFGDMIYPNYQNLASKRFSMFADVTSQKAYNYWDRIGDLIASFFPDKIKTHNIYFSTAIESIPIEYHENEHYLWLKSVKENQYLELNSIRKKTVHYSTYDTDYNYNHLDVVSDKNSIQLLQAERENLPNYYKVHLLLTIEAFEKTLLFINYINTILFPISEQ